MSSTNDPLGIIAQPNTPATVCTLSNISSRPALNGSYCQALEFSNGRYTVALFDAKVAAASMAGGRGGGSPQPQLLKVQPSSLKKSSQIDQVKLSVMVAFETAKLYANHDAVVDVGRKLTPSALRARISPIQTLSMLALIAGVGLILMVYLVGFSKLIVAFSLMALILTISSPDWMRGMKENKPMKVVVRQSVMSLGTRWKEMLVRSTGYNIPDKIATASLVLILFWTGKILLTPAAVTVVRSRPEDVAGIMQKPAYDFEFIYKLGYEDGKSGDDFGASLPSDVMAASERTPLDWDAYQPPLPRQPKPKLGMGTLLSLFALFSFGKDLLTQPDGSLIRDPNLIMMKLRALQPWRLGLMLMSLYRVVGSLSAFFR